MGWEDESVYLKSEIIKEVWTACAGKNLIMQNGKKKKKRKN